MTSTTTNEASRGATTDAAKADGYEKSCSPPQTRSSPRPGTRPRSRWLGGRPGRSGRDLGVPALRRPRRVESGLGAAMLRRVRRRSRSGRRRRCRSCRNPNRGMSGLRPVRARSPRPVPPDVQPRSPDPIPEHFDRADLRDRRFGVRARSAAGPTEQQRLRRSGQLDSTLPTGRHRCYRHRPH